MPALFTKKRGPDGKLQDPTPVFGEGKTSEQRLQTQEDETVGLNLQIVDLWEIVLEGGIV